LTYGRIPGLSHLYTTSTSQWDLDLILFSSFPQKLLGNGILSCASGQIHPSYNMEC